MSNVFLPGAIVGAPSFIYCAIKLFGDFKARRFGMAALGTVSTLIQAIVECVLIFQAMKGGAGA